MGGCSSSDRVGYDELLESLPGSMVADRDFDLFYSLCKVETVGTISMALHPSRTQLFYVVVSGQVVVHLNSPTIPNICATTFYPGDMIHFFNATSLHTPTQRDNSCMKNGKISLSLNFKGYTEKMGRVIGMDLVGWNAFLQLRTDQRRPLQSLLGMRLPDFIQSSKFFTAMTTKQMEMVGPLFRIRCADKANLVCFPSYKNHGLRKRYTSVGTTAVLLSGAVVSVAYNQNIDSLLDKLHKEKAMMRADSGAGFGQNSHESGPTTGTHRRTNIFSSTLSRMVNNKSTSARRARSGSYEKEGNNKEQSISVRSNRSSDKQSGYVSLTDSSSKALNQVALRPGAVLGYDTFLVRSSKHPLRKYVATSNLVIVGYLPPKVLDAFAEIDPRFLRVLSRNYFGLVLDSLKCSVPFFSGMDSASLKKLSGRVTLMGYSEGDLIYQKGEPGECAYVVINGSVALTAGSMDSNDKTMKMGSDEVSIFSGMDQVETVVSWGNMFGEVAVMTHSPYFHTAVVQEPSMALSITKDVFDELYFANKTKVCEIRIRLVGAEVDIMNIIDHPKGREAFRLFLVRTMAVENLSFYTSVDRFESLCADIVKIFTEMRKLRTRIDKNQENLNSLSSIHVDEEADALLATATDTCTTTVMTGPGTLPQDEKQIAALMNKLYDEMDAKAGQVAAAAAAAAFPGEETLGNAVLDTTGHSPPSELQTDPDGEGYDSEEDISVVSGDLQSDKKLKHHIFPHPAAKVVVAANDPSHESVSTAGVVSGDADALIAPGFEGGEIVDPTKPFTSTTFDRGLSRVSEFNSDDGTTTALTPHHPQTPGNDNINFKVRQKPTSKNFTPNFKINIHSVAPVEAQLNRSPSILSDILRLTTPKAKTKNAEIFNAADAQQIPTSEHKGQQPTPISLVAANIELKNKLYRRAVRAHQCMIDLREVARKIILSFVSDSAGSQVNISSKTRSDLENNFKAWSESLHLPGQHQRRRSRDTSLSIIQGADLAAPYVDVGGADGTRDGSCGGVGNGENAEPVMISPSLFANTRTSASMATSLDSAAIFAIENRDLSFTSLFAQAKLEILQVLRMDNYPRWQQTPEFKAFIASMIEKPEKETSVSFSNPGVAKLSHKSYDENSIAASGKLGASSSESDVQSKKAFGGAGIHVLYSGVSGSFFPSGKGLVQS